MTIKRSSYKGRRWNVLVCLAGSLLLSFLVGTAAAQAETPTAPQSNDASEMVAKLDARVSKLEAEARTSAAPPEAWSAFEKVGTWFALAWIALGALREWSRRVEIRETEKTKTSAAPPDRVVEDRVKKELDRCLAFSETALKAARLERTQP